MAAMVARQMRENQEKKEGPNFKWTEKERNLYELQQKSKSKLKVTDTTMRIFQDNREFLFSVRFSGGYSGEKQASTSWSSQVLQSAPPSLPSASAPGTAPGLSKSLRRIKNLYRSEMSRLRPCLCWNFRCSTENPLFLLTYLSSC